jgi:hypothetical protein
MYSFRLLTNFFWADVVAISFLYLDYDCSVLFYDLVLCLESDFVEIATFGFSIEK